MKRPASAAVDEVLAETFPPMSGLERTTTTNQADALLNMPPDMVLVKASMMKHL